MTRQLARRFHMESLASLPALTPPRSFRLRGSSNGDGDGVLKCEIAELQTASVVKVEGEIDLANIDVLDGALHKALKRRLPMVIELRDVSYIDSTGVNALVKTYERCLVLKTEVALVFTSPQLWRIFSVLSLQSLFPIFPDVDTALERFSCGRTS